MYKRNSKVKKITRYGKEGYDIHKMPEGTVMTVEFELDGQSFVALSRSTWRLARNPGNYLFVRRTQ